MKMTKNMAKLAAAVCLSMSLGLGVVSVVSALEVPFSDGAMPQGMPTQGMPPQGMPPQGMPPQGQQGKSISEFTAAQRITGKEALLVNQDITADEADENAVLAEQGADVTLQQVRLSKTGHTTSEDGSNFNGQNAVLLVSNSTAAITDATITSDAEGANAVFATGKNAVVTVKDIKINTQGNSSRGLDATYGGTIHGENVDITTAGAHCAALATDRGEGNVYATGSTLSTSGEGSPVIYSTGNIVLTKSSGVAKGSEIACVEGKNSIFIEDSTLTGYKNHGVMLYQSFSGDAGTGTASFTAKNSTLRNYSDGAMFYITNTKAVASLTNTVIESPKNKNLIEVSSDRWGTEGSNGGDFEFTATKESLSGNVVANNISTVSVSLTDGSTWSGTMNPKHTAKRADLSLDASSVWNVTGDSYVSALTDEDTTLGNIRSNGYRIYYDKSNAANAWLKGKTVKLADGGKLMPL
ncbi:hypothetical protein [uncultured Megasphaera sp.]|uniref:hypothetical protein n=1 Tax=uncultured Megasphaera sp. TaxID=165188 RepID=UPI0025F6ED68|nr:hypothetical protein [uncultured Megasphaera sp.]